MTAHIDLRELGSLGGFFALRDTGAAESDLPTLGRVYQSDAPVRDPLAYRVEKVARALSVPEPRVAVSVAQLGLAARLWSLSLGSAALFGRVPDLDPALLHWNPDAGAPDDLFLAGTGQLPADSAHIAELVLDRHLEPLSAALRARYRVSAPLLRGNAGSALAGAAREISRWARRAGRPDVAARACLLTTELFEDPRLTATGTRTGTAFRRTSCCLIYRTPGGGLCGDCCFERPPQHSSPPAASG
ncbi:MULTISPECIES: (2Fe-2S)-binding protein [unclassified Streptomyces]|uniref:(2Fe-2S)-binding protein n=1 Tax=unclassified Streptomyces TaxID=2593676 RepID=UPI0036EA7AFA